MKKLLALFMLTFAVVEVFAQKEIWKTPADIDLSEKTVNAKNNAEYFVEAYELKGGYRLIIRPVIEKTEEWTAHSNQLYLQKGKDLTLFLDKGDGGSDNIPALSKYFYRWEGFDFDDYFILSLFSGCYEHRLFEKSSGKLVLYWENGGKPIADLQNNLLIYNNEEKTEAYLLDLKSLKKYPLNPFLDEEFEHESLGCAFWWNDAFDFVFADAQKVKLRFWGFYKLVFDEKGEDVIDSETYSFDFDVKLW